MGKSEHHTLDNRICSLCLTIASLVMSVDQAITAAKTNALRSLNFYDGRFFGGLDKLIGPPRKDVAQAIKEEHCNVADGYGKSDQKLLSNNYNVEFTPQKEYEFVTNPDFCERMDAGTKIIVLTQFLIVPNLRRYDCTGTDPATKKPLGARKKVTLEELMATAVEKCVIEDLELLISPRVSFHELCGVEISLRFCRDILRI